MSNPFDPKLKKFSIITPIYGECYDTLDKFFGTLNESEYQEFEVIVVFDGENLKGEKELKKYMKKYPEMDIKSKVIEHGGAPKARNEGAKMATGDYLTFLDPDVYLYSDTLRFWADKFEEHPEKDVIWGLYDILTGEGKKSTIGGSIPVDKDGQVDYYALKATNYISGAFPVRKEAFLGWDESVKSLQDWAMWHRLLRPDFTGEKFLYICDYNPKYKVWVGRSFFVTEPIRHGGISNDSHTNWIDRLGYVKSLSDIPYPEICVTSQGAPMHALHVAKKLKADYLPLPQFKPHKYKMVYLLGFYTAGQSLQSHVSVFDDQIKMRAMEGKKVIHFIGTDVWQLRHSISWQMIQDIKNWLKMNKIVVLSEVDYIQKELSDLGIKSEVVPIPPQKLYEPMPLPKEFSVAVYDNPSQNMYNEKLMYNIAKAMPDIKFYFFGNNEKKFIDGNIEHLGWINLDDYMDKFSCNLRVTTHDGLPLTPIQFFTAGRHVVSNVPLKGAISTDEDRKNIIHAIRTAQTTPIDPKVAQYYRKELDFNKYVKSIRRILCQK